jgi:hypothetical protein
MKDIMLSKRELTSNDTFDVAWAVRAGEIVKLHILSVDFQCVFTKFTRKSLFPVTSLDTREV